MSNNGGYSNEENPVIALAKEVMEQIDIRDASIEEAVTAFETQLDLEREPQKAARDLVASVAMADAMYADNITGISIRYVQASGGDPKTLMENLVQGGQ
jgi:hypothetical protein